jgi:hypothetical protein
VGPRAGLDAVQKKISRPDSSAVKHETWSLYRLSYQLQFHSGDRALGWGFGVCSNRGPLSWRQWLTEFHSAVQLHDKR